MSNFFRKEPPPPVVLVPPLFNFPPLAARTRMLESSYNLLFGKIALKGLFEDYYEEARHFTTRIMLKPIGDPHVDLIATVSGPLDHNPQENMIGNALFRWQSDVTDPHTFVDLYVSTCNPILQMSSCKYHLKYGFGAFGIFPLLVKKSETSEDYGLMGLKYGSGNLSCGITLLPFAVKDELPRSAWLVSRMGRVTAGVQYEPHVKDELAVKDELSDRSSEWFDASSSFSLYGTSPTNDSSGSPSHGLYGPSPTNDPFGNADLEQSQLDELLISSFCCWPQTLSRKAVSCSEAGTNKSSNSDGNAKLTNLMNWSCAIGYSLGSGSLLSPSFNFCLELVKSYQFVVSFYQHMVVQRRVQNPFEESGVVGITNYIDLGFELKTRVDDTITSDGTSDSTVRVGASWQANKNLLVKAKIGPHDSSMALAFKLWWKPSFTFCISANRDHLGRVLYGYNIQTEDLREAR